MAELRDDRKDVYDVNIYVGGGGDCCTVAQGQGDISGFDGGI